MRKKILAVAAATVMTMSMATTAMAAVPTDYTGYYSFDGTLDNAAEGGEAATLTGATVTTDATVTTPVFVEGVNGQSLSFTGAGGYGVKLGQLITKNEYTVSFTTRVHAGTFGTSWVFIESMGGKASPEKWIGIQPVTENDQLDVDAPRVWSNVGGSRYDTRANESFGGYPTETWMTVTFVMEEKVGTLYVDGVAVAKAWVQPADAAVDVGVYGFPQAVVDSTTNVYLGVNYWGDALLNADMDDLYIYDRALTTEELKEVVGKDIVDDITLEEPATVEYDAPQLSDKNDSSIFDIEEEKEEAKDNTMMYVIIGVAAVVVVIVIVAVVLSSKKKNAADADEEE